MLGDLDQSVAAFLGRLLPAGTAIRFDAPAASWADAPPAAPLLGVYLYDIREAPQPPAADAVLARDEAGRPVGWQLPVRKYQVSYLLTAWPDDAKASQHELLGSVLVGCSTVDSIPPDCLHGVLAAQPEAVLFACASATPAVGAAQLCSGLRVPARAALDLMVVAPVVPPLLTELAPGVRDLKLSAENTASSGSPAAPPARPAAWQKRHSITE